MQQSKAGKKLSPIIKAAADPIYESDKERYKDLCRWIWWVQRRGWPDEAIANALDLSKNGIHLSTNWWAYLTVLLPKAKGRAAEAESNGHKAGDGAIAMEFVEFLKQRQAK